ncbi:MAG: hypothetical protein NVS3B2_09400 [Ramlibacter sp.]
MGKHPIVRNPAFRRRRSVTLKETNMSNRASASLTLLTFTVAVGAAAVPVLAHAAPAGEAADSAWARAHPRREQVNGRLANQRRRINKEVAEGDLTKAQAAKLHREDRQIRREERLMASQNGGHITRAEQKALNQQENAVSRQIGK